MSVTLDERLTSAGYTLREEKLKRPSDYLSDYVIAGKRDARYRLWRTQADPHLFFAVNEREAKVKTVHICGSSFFRLVGDEIRCA